MSSCSVWLRSLARIVAASRPALTAAARTASSLPKNVSDAELPTIQEGRQAFKGDLRSTSALGIGDHIYDHTGKWLQVRVCRLIAWHNAQTCPAQVAPQHLRCAANYSIVADLLCTLQTPSQKLLCQSKQCCTLPQAHSVCSHFNCSTSLLLAAALASACASLRCTLQDGSAALCSTLRVKSIYWAPWQLLGCKDAVKLFCTV